MTQECVLCHLTVKTTASTDLDPRGGCPWGHARPVRPSLPAAGACVRRLGDPTAAPGTGSPVRQCTGASRGESASSTIAHLPEAQPQATDGVTYITPCLTVDERHVCGPTHDWSHLQPGVNGCCTQLCSRHSTSTHRLSFCADTKLDRTSAPRLPRPVLRGSCEAAELVLSMGTVIGPLSPSSPSSSLESDAYMLLRLRPPRLKRLPIRAKQEQA